MPSRLFTAKVRWRPSATGALNPVDSTHLTPCVCPTFQQVQAHYAPVLEKFKARQRLKNRDGVSFKAEKDFRRQVIRA